MQPSATQTSASQPSPLQPSPLQPAAAPVASVNLFGNAIDQALSQAASDGPKSLRDGRLGAGTPTATQDDRLNGLDASVDPKPANSPPNCQQLVVAPDKPLDAVPLPTAAGPLQPTVVLPSPALSAQPGKVPASPDPVAKPSRPTSLAAGRPASPDADLVDEDVTPEPAVMAPQAPGPPIVSSPNSPQARSGPDATPVADPAGPDVIAIAEPGVAPAAADGVRPHSTEASQDAPTAAFTAGLPITPADASPPPPHTELPSVPTPPTSAAPRTVLQHIQAPPRATAAPPAEQVGPVLASFTASSALPGAPRQLVIRLDPSELGRVQLRIDRTPGGPARVELLVERPETLLLLLRDQPQLHRALDLAGVPAADRTLQFQLTPPEPHRSPMQAGAEFGDGSGPGQHRPGHSQRGAGIRPARPDDPTPHPASSWHRASVDIMA